MSPTKALVLKVFSMAVLSGACAKTQDPAPACPNGDDCRASSGELRAHDLRGPAHGMQPAGGPGAGMNRGGRCPIGSGALADEVRNGVVRALADERRAEVEYEQISARVRSLPMARIAGSELRHARELERLLLAHGHEVPLGPSEPTPIDVDDSRKACALGVASEKKNIAIYDELLAKELPPDVRCVFEHLRDASASRHLPAFERCAPH